MMLTPIEDPKAKLRVKARGWNPDWDPKRIWIDQFQESARTVKIKGLASFAKMYGVLKRLNTSRARHGINYSSATQVNQPADNITSSSSLVVIYGVADIKLLAEGKLGEN